MPNRLSVNHLLISTLAKRKTAKNPLKAGFTLVELLIVVIILGILAALALSSFLNQADKAKVATAQATASNIAKECQLHLVDPAPTFVPKTTSTPKLTVAGTACPGTFTVTIANVTPLSTASVPVLSDGSIGGRTGQGIVPATW